MTAMTAQSTDPDAPRPVFTLALRPLTHAGRIGVTRGVVDAILVNQGIDFKVEWDGDAHVFSVCTRVDTAPDSPTHGAPLEWHDLAAIEVTAADSIADQDIVKPSGKTSVFQARFRRGEGEPARQFSVKAVQIAWECEDDHVQALLADANFSARRQQHYRRAEDPNSVPWEKSSPRTVNESSEQFVAIELEIGCDYELWVKLEHPDGSGPCKILDPIVRTGNGGDGP